MVNINLKVSSVEKLKEVTKELAPLIDLNDENVNLNVTFANSNEQYKRITKNFLDKMETWSEQAYPEDASGLRKAIVELQNVLY